MTTFVFLLEEPSAEEMLKGVLPKILPVDVQVRYIVFDGKQDLDKKIERKMKSWQIPNTKFVILRDQDSGDCKKIKTNLLEKCERSGKTTYIVRIACHELESFYLGDLLAVEHGLELKFPKTISQDSRKFKTPDNLANPSTELRLITGEKYQKITGSKAIAPHLKIDDSNRSVSYNILLDGIRNLLEVA